MSMFGDALAVIPKPGIILPDDRRFPVGLVSRERGGVALNDASEGVNKYTWTAVADPDTGKVVLTREGARSTVLGIFGPLRSISIAFDQNMQPALAYVNEARDCKLYWYDSTVPGYVTLTLPASARDPCLTLDDKRVELITGSDILLFYTIGTNLYYRQQRDRFTIERLIYTGVQGRLFHVGMNTTWCVQLEFTDDYPDDF